MTVKIEPQVQQGLKGRGNSSPREVAGFTFPSAPGTNVEERLDALEFALSSLATIMTGMARLIDQNFEAR